MVRSLLAVLVLVMALSGCATIPLASIAALSSIKLETTDLAVFRVAMRLPDALRPLSDSVRLETVTRIDGLAEKAEQFELVAVADPTELAELGERIYPGYSVHVFALSPEGRKGLEAVRQAIAEAQAGGKPGALSLSIALKDFCTVSRLPDGPLYFTTLIKTSETGHFVVFNNRVDMRSTTEFAAALRQVQPCVAQ